MAEDKIAKIGETGLTGIFGDAGSLAQRPDFIPAGDKTGTEDIEKDDIRLPRLGIAQGLSPQMMPGDPLYIPGLQLFQLFNDFTKQVYGNGPLYFIPVRRDKVCIEFGPDRKGVVDMNVPWNDPRATQWNGDEPPVATRFNEWVALLLREGAETEPIVISIKMTNKHNRRAASDLNGMIKMHASQGARSVPIYGVVYSIESTSTKNDQGTFGIPVVRQAGFVPNNDMGAALFLKAGEYAEALGGKKIVVDRETPAVDGQVVDPEM